MVGGRFTGSNTSETTHFVVLATITRTPAENAWTELTFPNQTVYRYIKYEAPNGGWGNVAEVEFYSGTTWLRGRNFGTAGSVGNGGNDFTKALDEDTRTFFDAPTAGGAYVGMDLRAENQVAAPTFSPEPWTYRTARKVVLRTPTHGASIRYRYTTDGADRRKRAARSTKARSASRRTRPSPPSPTRRGWRRVRSPWARSRLARRRRCGPASAPTTSATA
jgi:hypothetical protein